MLNNTHTAEDAVQEVFTKIFKFASGFKYNSSFKTWMYSIATNTCLTMLHKNKRNAELSDSYKTVPSRCSSGRELRKPILFKDASELDTIIKEKIQNLPEMQKTVLILSVYENMSLEEISNILNCSYDSAKQNLSIAKRKLREELNNIL